MQRTDARATPAALHVLFGLLAAASLWASTFPWEQCWFVDGWDYLWEMQHLPWWQGIFRVSTDGQLNPTFKALIWLFVGGSGYQNLPLTLFNAAVRAGTLGLAWVLLGKLGCRSVPGALCLAAIPLSKAGIVEVFSLVIQGGQELAFLLLMGALCLVVDLPTGRRAWLASGLLVLAAFSWGNGMAMPFALLGALLLGLLLRRGKELEPGHRDLLRASAVACAVVAGIWLAAQMVPRPQRTHPPLDVVELVRYYYYTGIVHGAVSGLSVQWLRGWYHLGYFALLAAGSLAVFLTDQPLSRKLVVAALFLTQQGTSVLVALSRWDRGFDHASSFRYVYDNLVPQLLLTAILLGVLLEKVRGRRLAVPAHTAAFALALALYTLGWHGAMKVRPDIASIDTGRWQELKRVLAEEPGATGFGTLYQFNRPDFLRDTWRGTKREPPAR